MTSPHPAMTRILDVIERLQERPYRTNFILSGEPGTGKEGLGRALHQLMAPAAPLVRLDVVGFPEDEALAALCGRGKEAGVAEQADGGTIIIEETAGLGPRVQLALLRLLKAGKCERVGTAPSARGRDGAPPRRLQVNAIALTDRDLLVEVAAGRLRHDLYYRLARVLLWLPPLRDRMDDIAPSAIWMGNRVLDAAGLDLEVRSSEDLRQAGPAERARAVELDAGAVDVLRRHGWPGNFRELETVLERALLLYRESPVLRADDIRAALALPLQVV